MVHVLVDRVAHPSFSLSILILMSYFPIFDGEISDLLPSRSPDISWDLFLSPSLISLEQSMKTERHDACITDWSMSSEEI
jgi:hypothetical protein